MLKEAPKCIFCPDRRGIMLKLASEPLKGKWIHVSCVNFLSMRNSDQKVDFALNEYGYKITNQLASMPNFEQLSNFIEPNNKQYTEAEQSQIADLQKCCYLCGDSEGAKRGCDFGNCPVRFHYRCAISQGALTKYFGEQVFCTIHKPNVKDLL